MPDREFTLLELHVHSHGDTSILPGIRTGGEESKLGELLGGQTESSSIQSSETSDEGSRRLPRPLVALAVVVVAGAVAAAFRRRRSPPESPEDRRRILPS